MRRPPPPRRRPNWGALLTASILFSGWVALVAYVVFRVFDGPLAPLEGYFVGVVAGLVGYAMYQGWYDGWHRLDR